MPKEPKQKRTTFDKILVSRGSRDQIERDMWRESDFCLTLECCVLMNCFHSENQSSSSNTCDSASQRESVKGQYHVWLPSQDLAPTARTSQRASQWELRPNYYPNNRDVNCTVSLWAWNSVEAPASFRREEAKHPQWDLPNSQWALVGNKTDISDSAVKQSIVKLQNSPWAVL